MNVLDRAIGYFSPEWAESRGAARARMKFFGYDAAEDKGRRGSSGGAAKNASSESYRMARNRVDLMWSARDLERNMPVVRCVIDRLAQYVCGTIAYQSRTGDPSIDAAYESYLEDWMRRVADVTGRHDFRLLTKLAFRGAYRDGDYFFKLVRQGRLLQVQCIEADRVGDPHKVTSGADPDLIQGIRIDKFGRPVSYQIFNREPRSSRYTFAEEAPANQVFHLCNPIRADEYRTVSAFAPVVGKCRDLYEMFEAELDAAKWAASIAGVIKTTDPQFRIGPDQMAMWDGAQQKGELPKVAAQPRTLLKLRPNEDVSVFNTGARPAGAFLAFIEAAVRDIAMGLNLPYGFFDMQKFGGAVVRLEAMQLQRTFAQHQNNLELKMLDPVKNAVLENGIALREIPPHPNFRTGRWQFGAHLTADTGYDTDANLQLLAHGLKTAAEVSGEQGEDWEDTLDQAIKEAVTLRDKCAAAGVPVELVAGARFPNATQQLAAANEAMQPPVAPQLSDIGDGGVKAIQDLLEMAANGTLPRENVVALLVQTYGFAPEAAASVVPEKQALAVKANMPAPPQAGKPGDKQAPGKKEETDDGT